MMETSVSKNAFERTQSYGQRKNNNMFIHITTDLHYMETYTEYQPQILSAAMTLLKHLKQDVT
jgi:hypothetical protein